MKHKRAVHGYKAFTLIELLLGLAITAIIGLSVYNMFWQSMRLDDKMRHVHENYMELLMADQVMTRDLENAMPLDLSGSYADAKIFEGRKTEFSFLTQTPGGIRRVSYYAGLPDSGPLGRAMIGRVVNSSSSASSFSGRSLPVAFLLRKESSLAEWLTESSENTSAQIVASGLKKDSFYCRYAHFVKDLHTAGSRNLDYQDNWDDKAVPLAVSCSFVLYDPKNPDDGLMFKREIFLAPVANYYNE